MKQKQTGILTFDNGDGCVLIAMHVFVHIQDKSKKFEWIWTLFIRSSNFGL